MHSSNSAASGWSDGWSPAGIKAGIAALAAIVGLTALTVSADAQRGGADGWENLGCVDVGKRPDLDVINVGRRDGRFKAIRVQVRGKDVEIYDLRVIYENGQPDDIKLRENFRAGSQSRAIDLKGRDRFIRRIELISRRDQQRGRGRGEICILGLETASWQNLGCVDVGKRPDFDVIEVGRRDGRFKAIRVKVRGKDVDLYDMRVIYGNGQPDNIQLRKNLKGGSLSPAIDLKGKDRFLRRIELISRLDQPRGRGRGEICIFGLES